MKNVTPSKYSTSLLKHYISLRLEHQAEVYALTLPIHLTDSTDCLLYDTPIPQIHNTLIIQERYITQRSDD